MTDPTKTTALLIKLERLILEHRVNLLRGGYDALTHQTDTMLAVCRRAMGAVPTEPSRATGDIEDGFIRDNYGE